MEVWQQQKGCSEEILCLASAPSGYVASAGSGGVAVRSSDGKVVHTISGLLDSATSVAFFNKRSDGLLVASGANVLSYDLRNLAAPTSVFQVGDEGEELNDLGINERDQYVAVCDDAGIVRVIDLRANRLFKTMRSQHENICSSLAFRPQRPWQVVSVGLDCRLVRWDFSRGRPLQVIQFDQACTTADIGAEAADDLLGATPMVNPPMIHQADFHRHGDWLILAGGDCSVRLLHSHGRSPLTEICKWNSVHKSSVSQAQFTRFSPDRLAMSGGNDSRIVVWNVEGYMSGKVNPRSLTTVPSGANERSAVVKIWKHHSKINWLTSGWDPAEGRIFVADQTSNISVYRVDW